ncbi:c-type cytochrome [Herbaspirillum seropedicae]|uniref:c-type cytochrome n=1 Tax=Herbaspirillum seropedicae TaxID=964 RepID=UPI003D993A36
MKPSILPELLLLTACLAAPACPAAEPADAQQGRRLLATRGCAACHSIPGIAPGQTLVGPPLDQVAKASYVAGILPNSQANLARWIMHPRHFHPQSAMPELGLSEQEAADMAAYLYQISPKRGQR